MFDGYSCLPCVFREFVGAVNRNFEDRKDKERALRSFFGHMAKADYDQSPPELVAESHRVIRSILGIADPYREIKEAFNDKMMDRYGAFKELVASAEDPFDRAARLAVAGNIIDFGPGKPFDVDATLDRVLSEPFAVDEIAELNKAVKAAGTVLYLGDNAGEIVLDKLFIETMGHPNLFFAVRGRPVINDATAEDARRVGMEDVAKVVDNGHDAPGTLLEHTSEAFRSLYNQADLVLSKGQGNLESLWGKTDKPLYFLLMAKCDLVAGHLGVQTGDMVVMRHRP